VAPVVSKQRREVIEARAFGGLPAPRQPVILGAMYRGMDEDRTVPCSVCGTRIERSTALLSTQGEPVCRGCDATQKVAISSQRAGLSVFYGALGALALGLFSIPCNIFFLLSFGAILGGIVSLRLVMRPELRAQLGDKYAWTMVAAIAAIVCGAVQPLVWLMVLAGVTAASILR
jgi:hypothetical protein